MRPVLALHEGQFEGGVDGQSFEQQEAPTPSFVQRAEIHLIALEIAVPLQNKNVTA